jgi:hypothetical protein
MQAWAHSPAVKTYTSTASDDVWNDVLRSSYCLGVEVWLTRGCLLVTGDTGGVPAGPVLFAWVDSCPVIADVIVVVRVCVTGSAILVASPSKGFEVVVAKLVVEEIKGVWVDAATLFVVCERAVLSPLGFGGRGSSSCGGSCQPGCWSSS